MTYLLKKFVPSSRWFRFALLSYAVATVARLWGGTPAHAEVLAKPEDAVKELFNASYAHNPYKNGPIASSYGQGTYYSEGTYYSQPYYQTTYEGSYNTTFTKQTLAAEDFIVRGQLSKSSGTFVIDHPLAPITKLLYHSFVESPEMKNLYDGIATLNEDGETTIRLPGYFMALNTDFRYQLKPLGEPQPNLYLKDEVANNRFTIAGGIPDARVSWQITGNRHDVYAKENPVVAEVDKGPGALVDEGEYHYEGNRPKIEWLLPKFVRSWFER